MAWLWLRQGLVAARALERQPAEDDVLFYKGKLQAAAYYFDWELPQLDTAWRILSDVNGIAHDMQDAWY